MKTTLLALLLKLSLAKNDVDMSLRRRAGDAESDGRDRRAAKDSGGIYSRISTNLKLEKRIVGGEDVLIDTASSGYPWYSAMFKTGSRERWGGCGGTLIGPWYVLTAAHCVSSTDPDKYAWDIGAYCSRDDRANNCNQTAEYIGVSEVHVHPYYIGNRENDLVLMRLNKPSSQQYIHPDDGTVCELENMEPLTVIGFGRINNRGETAYRLQHTEVGVLDNLMCRGKYAGVGAEITDDMLCSYKEFTDTCQGDSGGPVICKRAGVLTLAGVISWGSRWCAIGFPSVHARVGHADHFDWIKGMVCDNPDLSDDKPSWCPGVSKGDDHTSPSTTTLSTEVASPKLLTEVASPKLLANSTTTSTTTTTTTFLPTDRQDKCEEEKHGTFYLKYVETNCHVLATKYSQSLRNRICNRTDGRRKCPSHCNHLCSP